MIKRNAKRLLNLVNQLLDFRKMEEHELKLQRTEGELISFVKDVDHFPDKALVSFQKIMWNDILDIFIHERYFNLKIGSLLF